MRGSLILLFLAVVALPFPAVAGITCKAKTPPRITVKPSKSRIKYDFTKTKADLNRRDVDTISPYGPQHVTNVSGLMSGTIQLKSQVGFMHETYKYLGRACLFLSKVDVVIHVEPTIFIAREFPKGGCMHNAILTHEFKHVKEDQLIIDKYINLIGRKLAQVVDYKGDTFGPIKAVRMREMQHEIQADIQQVVIDMNDKMNKERKKRQQAIDSLEEYQSIGKRCKRSN